MKHLKIRKILAVCVSLVVVALMPLAVFAGTSGKQMLPSFTAGSWKETSAYSVKASSKDKLTYGNTTVAFGDYSSLTGSFASNNNRAMIVQVWDDDGWASGDDLVVTYTSNFSGRKLSGTWTRAVNGSTSTKIDDNDDTGEMYLKYQMTKLGGDRGSIVGDGFFSFNIKIA